VVSRFVTSRGQASERLQFIAVYPGSLRNGLMFQIKKVTRGNFLSRRSRRGDAATTKKIAKCSSRPRGANKLRGSAVPFKETSRLAELENTTSKEQNSVQGIYLQSSGKSGGETTQYNMDLP